jgi:hypothetical protein
MVGPGVVPVAIAVATDLGSPQVNWSPVGRVGQPFALTLTVVDRYHNQVRRYGGTIRCDLWRWAAGAQVLAPYAFQREDSGKHTFSVTVGASGEWNLVCFDVADPRLAGAVTVNILAP